MAAQAEQLLAGGGVPDVGGGAGDVVGDDAAAVGTPGDHAHPAALAAVEAEDLLAGGGVPDPGLGRVEGGDDAARVRAPRQSGHRLDRADVGRPAVGAHSGAAPHEGHGAHAQQLGAGGDVPDPGGAVIGGGGHAGPVRAPRHRGEVLRMTGQCAHHLAAGGVPDAGRGVVEAGEDAGGVGTPGHCPADAGAADPQGQQVGTGGRVPDAHAVVLRRGEQTRAVGTPGHRTDGQTGTCEREQLGAAVRVPDPGRAVVRSGQEPRPIRAPGHTPQRVEVAGIQ